MTEARMTVGNGSTAQLSPLHRPAIPGCLSCGVGRHQRTFKILWVTSLMAVSPVCGMCWSKLTPKRRLHWFMIQVDGWTAACKRPEELKRVQELRQLIREAVEREGDMESKAA